MRARCRPLLVGPALVVATGASAQSPAIEAFKVSPRISQAALYETNPASLPYGARGYWSSSTVVGIDASTPLASGVALSASAQNKFWRYPQRARWHSNDASGSLALTVTRGPLSYGARVGAFGSYDPGFSERKEMRADAAAFVSRTFEDSWSGAQLIPTLTLSHRRADDHDGDKMRASASLVALRKFGALGLSARVAVALDIYRRRQPMARRDVEFNAGLGATWALTKQAELGVGLDMERAISNKPGAGYIAATIAPRAAFKLDF